MDLVFRNVRIYSPGVVVDGDALAVSDGRIDWIGPSEAAPRAQQAVEGHGQWLTPGLIDCHTHAIWAGNRTDEFEARMAGDSYEAIAQRGGGILSTVRATREATEQELIDLAQPRIDQLARAGVTTVDVKSGYGLSVDDELKCLRSAAALKGPRIVRGFLGAHAIPPEFRDARDQAMDFVIHEMLLEAEAECDYIDAFCESVAYSKAEVDRLFSATSKPVRLHADQLSDSGGGALAARHRALSADHLEFVSDESLAAMAEAETVAVLLPGAFYMLRERQKPPIDRMRTHGVRMAVSTDLNPGTSPLASLPLMMNLACVLFGLTVDEVWQGVTRHAAEALGRSDLGRLQIGARADLALWSFDHPRELVGSVGLVRDPKTWVDGRVLSSGESSGHSISQPFPRR